MGKGCHLKHPNEPTLLFVNRDRGVLPLQSRAHQTARMPQTGRSS